jgi:hypothetical protein
VSLWKLFPERIIEVLAIMAGERGDVLGQGSTEVITWSERHRIKPIATTEVH